MVAKRSHFGAQCIAGRLLAISVARDDPHFRKTVRDHGRHRPAEEVQDPVMNAPLASFRCKMTAPEPHEREFC